jgi:hypothetical protein
MHAASSGQSADQRFRSWRFALICAALCCAVAIPFFTTRVPPLNDYPSHLARAHIITSIDSSTHLQRYYAIHWQLVPNLGLDLFVPLLSAAVDVELAMAAFTLGSLLLCLTGVSAMHRALFAESRRLRSRFF